MIKITQKIIFFSEDMSVFLKKKCSGLSVKLKVSFCCSLFVGSLKEALIVPVVLNVA